MQLDLLARLLDLLRDPEQVNALIADPEGFLEANDLGGCDAAEFAEALPLALAEVPGGPEMLASCPPIETWAEIGPAQVLVHAVGGAAPPAVPWATPAPQPVPEHAAPAAPVTAPVDHAPVIEPPVVEAPADTPPPPVDDPALDGEAPPIDPPTNGEVATPPADVPTNGDVATPPADEAPREAPPIPVTPETLVPPVLPVPDATPTPTPPEVAAPDASAVPFPEDGSGFGPNDDFDSDGLSNSEEGFLDRDADGVLDAEELFETPDADGDGFIDAEESLSFDADGDGIADQFDNAGRAGGTFEDDLPSELQDIAAGDAQNAIDAIDGFAAPVDPFPVDEASSLSAFGSGAPEQVPGVDDVSIIDEPDPTPLPPAIPLVDEKTPEGEIEFIDQIGSGRQEDTAEVSAGEADDLDG